MSRSWTQTLPAWLADAKVLRSPVLSTRIRLARNFAEVRFTPAADPSELEGNLSRIEKLVRKQTRLKMNFTPLCDLDDIQRGLYAERGLVHQDSALQPDHVGLAVGGGETVSLLVNEEDHLRIQVIQGGLNLAPALAAARDLDQILARVLPYASHRQFGYLTACPTNVGTGLRASVMLHLPALALTRGIVQVLQAVLHMGLAVRGFYGEGTELRSVYFQVSNQITLGRTEDEIVAHLAGVTRQIVDREEEARHKLLQDQRLVLADKVGRAWAVLTGCVLLSLEEGLDLLSTVRLGVETGLLSGPEPGPLNELLLLIQPAHLQALSKQKLSAEDQARKRAELIKKKLKIKK
jgi:protein arginine kinase